MTLSNSLTHQLLAMIELKNRVSDINECVTLTHNCDVNAKCTDTGGSYTCKCVDGYTGNGTQCISECFASFVEFVKSFEEFENKTMCNDVLQISTSAMN